MKAALHQGHDMIKKWSHDLTAFRRWNEVDVEPLEDSRLLEKLVGLEMILKDELRRERDSS